MKECVTCHERKPLSEFNVRRIAADGRQPRCRDCCKAWYAANRERHQAAAYRRTKAQRRVNQEWVAGYLLDRHCVDCGENDIRCLDFDHRPETQKHKDIAKLVYSAASLARIQSEIEKCDVRCANCHRRRTAERGGFWRQSVQEEVMERAAARAATRLMTLCSLIGWAG